MSSSSLNRMKEPSSSRGEASTSGVREDIEMKQLTTVASSSYVDISSLSSKARSAASSIPSTDSSRKNVRVVGRGGRGSQPRNLSQLSSLEESRVPGLGVSTNELPKAITPEDRNNSSLRLVGRGGSGSRPRVAKPEALVPPSSASKGKQPMVPASTIRMAGRGGAASRPRPVNILQVSLNAETTSTTKSKLKWKSKAKLSFRSNRSETPTQPSFYSGDSTSTVSDIIFPTHPASIANTPFNAPTQSDPINSQSSGDSSSLTHFSSVDHIPLQKGATLSSPTPAQERRNLNSLARRLGDLPPDENYKKLSNEQNGQRERKLSKVEKDDTGARMVSRRPSLSISISSFVSFPSILRARVPPRRRRPTITSQHTCSTMTDDVHQFGLADDLSESWNESSSLEDSNVSSSTTPPSPITFSSPTPLLTTAASSAISIDSHPTSDDASEVADSLSSLTFQHSDHLSRSQSYRQSNERSQHYHSPSDPWSVTPFGFDINARSTKPNSSRALEDGTVSLTYGAAEPLQVWEGKWNRGDMQDVIQTLRNLR